MRKLRICEFVCVCAFGSHFGDTPTLRDAHWCTALLDKRMPRAPLGLDRILVTLKVIIELILLMIMMAVTAAMMLLRLLMLLDRHRNGQRYFLYDCLGVDMRVMLHRHMDANSANANEFLNVNGFERDSVWVLGLDTLCALVMAVVCGHVVKGVPVTLT